jgi:hypothetical protein
LELGVYLELGALCLDLFVDFALLTFELQQSHVGVPVIATPREIVRKFFGQGPP